MRRRSGASVSAALRTSMGNRELRLVQLARLASVTGRWAYAVTLAVYAYRESGAGGVAAAGLVRLIPAAVAAPLTGMLALRVRPGRLLLAGGVLRTAALAAAGVLVLAGQPVWVVFAAVACESAISSVLRPVQGSLVPSLSRTPEELTATNLALSVIESAGLLIGPLVGALLLHGSSVGIVFLVAAASYGISVLLLLAVHIDEGRGAVDAGAPPPQSWTRALGRLRYVASRRDTAVVLVLYGAQNLVAGALNVLIVVTALRLLDLGQSSVGALTAALGVGGVIGGGLVLTRLRRRRHAADLVLGLMLWSAPVIALALVHSETWAFILLAVVGIGVTVVDVSAVSLLQRAAEGELLTDALGLLQGVFVASVGIGTLLAPVLVHSFGVRGALIATGVPLPLLAGALWKRISRLDGDGGADAGRVELLGGIAIFAPLTDTALDRLALALAEVPVAAGDVVFAQGDLGDAFYVVESGTVEVVIDGKRVAVLGPSDFFGEIALLRDVPRTATIRAREDGLLLRLAREPFLETVTGNRGSASAADAIVGARFGFGTT